MVKKSKPIAAKQTVARKKARSVKQPAASFSSVSETKEKSSHFPSSQAQALFELHLQHELAAFDPPALVAWCKQNSDAFHHWAQNTRIESLVTRDKLKEVYRRHLIDTGIPQVIAELTRDSILRLLDSSDHQSTKVNELMNDAQFNEFVEQLLIFEEQRASILDSMIDLPIYGDLISGVVYEAIIRYIYESNVLTKKIPGVSSMLKMGRSVVNKTAPKLGGAVEEGVRNYIAGNLDFILKVSKDFLDDSLTDEQIRVSARYVWNRLADQNLAGLQRNNSNEHVTDLTGLGYDFGLDFRKTAWLPFCIDLAIDCFFDQYGAKTINKLMEDLAIDGNKILLEMDSFLPDIVTALKGSGCLEHLIRARLYAFYGSAPVLAFFENKSPQESPG